MSDLSAASKSGITAGLIIIIAVLYLFNPAVSALYPRCMFNLVTGYFCPGCGSLRALHHLLHGNFIDAAKMNPLLVTAIPIISVNCFIAGLCNRKFVTFQPPFNSTYAAIIVFCIMIFYTIARNIPLPPFNLLAPH